MIKEGEFLQSVENPNFGYHVAFFIDSSGCDTKWPYSCSKITEAGPARKRSSKDFRRKHKLCRRSHCLPQPHRRIATIPMEVSRTSRFWRSASWPRRKEWSDLWPRVGATLIVLNWPCADATGTAMIMFPTTKSQLSTTRSGSLIWKDKRTGFGSRWRVAKSHVIPRIGLSMICVRTLRSCSTFQHLTEHKLKFAARSSWTRSVMAKIAGKGFRSAGHP